MGYPTKPLGEVAEIASGYGFPHKYQGRTDGEIPFYKVGDMNTSGNEVVMTVAQHTVTRSELAELRAKAFPRGTVIMPKIGAAIRTGKKRILGSEAAYDNNVVGIVPRDGVLDSSYLFHWTKTVDFSLLAQDSDVPSLRKSVLQSLLIPLPPTEEQRRVAHLLDEADRLQRLRQEANEKAQRILQALFVEMFGDPETNPMGWEVKPVKDVLLDATSGTWGDEPSGSHTGIPVLRSTNIQNGLLVLDDVAYRVVGERAAAKSTLGWGDIIVTTSSGSKAHIGKNAFFGLPDDSGRFLYSNFTLRLRPDGIVVAPRFLHVHLNTEFARGYLDRIQSTTSGLRNLDKTGYLDQPVMLPPLPEQERFAALAERLVSLNGSMANAGAALALCGTTLRSRLFAQTD